MAHPLTPQQIDEAAAADAAAQEPTKAENVAGGPPPMTTLAYGAEGASVSKLVNLLAELGHNSNNVIKGGPALLDESVLVDVRAAQEALAVPHEQLEGVEGELVGEATWDALYEAVAAKLEAEQPADTAGDAPAAGDPSASTGGAESSA